MQGQADYQAMRQKGITIITKVRASTLLVSSLEAGAHQIQNLPQCATQIFYENRVSHYNVVYEYQRTRHTAQMLDDPGLYVRLQVTPVGAMTTAPQAFPSAPPPQAYPAYCPQPYYAPAYAAPVHAPVYAPIDPPIGLSLNFGFSRVHGRHRR